MSRTDERNKVRVGAMVGFAYRSVFGRLGLALDVGWVMLLVLLAVLILPGMLLPRRYGGDELPLGMLDYGRAVVVLLTLTAFAVRWYQSILAGDPHRLSPRAFFSGWARFLIYGCVAYVVIGLLATVVLLVLYETGIGDNVLAASEVELGAIVAGFLLAAGLLRFGLLFPAAACGEPLPPVTAWRMMRGNTWRLVWATILTAAPVTFTAFVLTAIVIAVALPGGTAAEATPPLGFAILAGLIETVANFLLVALGASLLAGFYRALVTRRVGPPSDQR